MKRLATLLILAGLAVSLGAPAFAQGGSGGGAAPYTPPHISTCPQWTTDTGGCPDYGNNLNQ
jgi:hypothetical protein